MASPNMWILLVVATLAASIPCTWASFVGERQPRIPPAQRHVNYNDGDAIWHQAPYGYRPTRIADEQWHELAIHHDPDTLEDVHEVFAELRQGNRRRRFLQEYLLGLLPDQGNASAPVNGDDLGSSLDNFVNVPTGAFDTGTPGDASSTANPAKTGTPEANASTVEDFNVTVTTEYNVSTSTANHTLNDTSTVIYTNVTNSSDPLLDHGNATLADHHGDPTPSDNNTTSTTTNNETAKHFHPMRLRAFLSDVDGGAEHLTTAQREALLQDMLRPALLTWSSVLRVVPVAENLTVDASQLTMRHNDSRLVCGTESVGVPVPDDHMAVGVPHTDMIVYLSLGFVEAPENTTTDGSNATAVPFGNATVDGNTTVVTDGMPQSLDNATATLNETASPSQHLQAGGVFQGIRGKSTLGNDTTVVEESSVVNQTASGNATGSESSTVARSNTTEANSTNANPSNITDGNSTISEVDNATETRAPKRYCSGEYLAASSFCSMDQHDRPTAAMVHICIGPDFFDPENLQRNVLSLLHELGHSLGFNSHSLALFRRRDGTPLTPRLPNGQVPLQPVECTGPAAIGSNVTYRPTALIPLPSPEILQFGEVRGGVRVAHVVTPSVRQVVRNHFDCQSLPGAELESGERLPGGDSSCLGDHWERRLFKYNLMNPVIDDLEFHPRIPTITLAYFADSGWYQVDLSRAAAAASWGRAAGCAFVEEACIRTSDGQVPPEFDSFFCNSAPRYDGLGSPLDIQGCTPDLSRKAACSMGRYEDQLPLAYQYFNLTYGASVGGSDPFLDFCPVYDGFSNGLCADPENEALIRVNQIETIGRRNSRCLSSHRRSRVTALCLPIACVVEDHSLRIKVDRRWKKCPRHGFEIVASTGDTIVCPDPIRVCPTFYCHRDCLGTDQICDYTEGKCICNATGVVPPKGKTCADVEEDALSELDETENENANTTNTTKDKPQRKPRPPNQFYVPKSPKNEDLPADDSPLADYYVPTERYLSEEASLLDLSVGAYVGIAVGGLVSLTILVFMVWWCIAYNRRAAETKKETSSPDDDNGETPVLSEAGPSTNPKDKLMAATVVNLRMNDSNLQRYTDVLRDRTSETDISQTDTEGTVARPPSETLDDDDDDLMGSDDPPPVQAVIRRRHIPRLV